MNGCTIVFIQTLSFCSHLNSLVPVFNKVAREHFIDNLRSRADGETVVDMLKEFGNATLQMISTVQYMQVVGMAVVNSNTYCAGCIRTRLH